MYLECTNRELLEEMGKTVIGHETAKKLLITLVNRSKLSHRLKYIEDKEPLEKMNLLLIGASGTGKTYMVDRLAHLVRFPLIKVDASKINPIGNNSYSVQSVERAIVRQASFLVDKYPEIYPSLEGTVSRTIVFMDEFDKLALDYGNKDTWQQRVQSEILTLVENTEQFRDVSFVFAGAFTGLRNQEEKSSIGFTNTPSETTNSPITEEDLIDHGVVTELMGRINAFTELDVLTEDMMLEILETQLLPKKIRDLSLLVPGAGHLLTQEAKLELVTEAIASGQGVRHMKRKLNSLFLDLEFDYEDNNRFIDFSN